ncbi:MFS transporter [Gordonia sp. CPCC 206044]|uniref:MFS transporter n=1 Tax=Gordonia sp. CPCC 206044 TaxID=3140793 RepID=UPI003AF366F7
MSVTSTRSSRSVDHTGFPPLIHVLALGTFLMGTTEFIVAGLLPQIADDLRITVARAGLMITVFAVGMIVGTPLMALATVRVSPRTTLVASLGVFAVGHVVLATATRIDMVLAARFITALATGGFWAVAAVVASRTVGPSATPRALGIVLGGGMLANVLGVPLGAFAGQIIGWRGPFWILAASAGIAALAVARLVPGDPGDRAQSTVRKEVASLRDPRIWYVLAGCAVVCGSSLSVYSYIAPLLMNNSGLRESAVPLVLVAYGAGACVGSYVGGRVGSVYPLRVLSVAAAMTTLVLVALGLLSHLPLITVVLVTLLGLFGMSTNPVLVAMAVRFAGDTPTLASALTTSSFNLGTAIGSGMAGMAIQSRLGATGPVVIGAVIAVLYCVPIGFLWTRLDHSRR